MSTYTFKLVKSTAVPLTRALIEEFANMAGSITERPRDDRRCAYIRDRVATGLAVPFHWAKAQIEGEETWYRVNGQHSSYELLKMWDEGLIPEGLMVHIDEYVVSSKEALITLFRQFDPRISSRKALDVTNAYASAVDDLNDINREVVKLATEAIWWYRRNILKEKDAADGDDRYEITLDARYHPFIKWLVTATPDKAKELKNIGAVAAMWATYEISPDVASVFWHQAAIWMPNGTEPEDPADVMDEWLDKGKKMKPKLGPKFAFQGCIYAWNAHVDDKEINKIAPPDWKNKGFLTPKYPSTEQLKAAE